MARAKVSDGSDERDSETPRPRRAGRPARLSREGILAASIRLLEQGTVGEFTLAAVAKDLDTVSMALYNYYPSREALLAAVADRVCMRFRMPRAQAGQSWQQTLRQWLKALRRHVVRYPVILKVMGFEGQSTAGWLRIALTVARVLHTEGLRGRDLALEAYLFCSQAVNLIIGETVAGDFHGAFRLDQLGSLDATEQELLRELGPHHAGITSDDVLNEGFERLIQGLERRFGAQAASSSSASGGIFAGLPIS